MKTDAQWTGIAGHRSRVTNPGLARDGQIQAKRDELVTLHGSQGTRVLVGLPQVHSGWVPSSAAAQQGTLKQVVEPPCLHSSVRRMSQDLVE